MADAVAGITLPPGDPGSIRDTASGLERVASGFGRTGDTARAAAASVSWTGSAAEAFGQRTGDYEDAGRKADVACMRAAAVLKTFADRLEEGREKVKRLQEQAEEAQRRMNTAAAGAVEAGRLEGDARARATSLSLSATLDPTGSSFTEQNQAYADADAYAAERARLEGVATRARDELERLQEEARLEREAVKEAATAASGQMNGAQDGLPVVYHGGMYGTAGAMEDRVLARVRAGDYDVLTGLSINTLDEDTQRAVGAEIAKDADEAAYNEGDHSLEEVSSVVSRFGTDNEFASGFYNQLGGRGTADLAQNIVYFHGQGEGLEDPALLALMAPFANMLGTATRSGALRPGFTSGFMRKDLSVRDRYGGHQVMSAFVMSGTASRYSPAFLSAVGEEVLITPSANPDDGINFHELSENQDLMQFISENPEAAAQLLAGHHGPGNHFSNAAPLMMYGPRYTDDGEALGSLIRAGTHDALAYDRATAIDAGETIIKITPEFADHMPDGTKDALVTILDDHVSGFEYAAVHEANPSGDYVRGDTVDISYDEGRKYLTALLGFEGEPRDEAATIIGSRVESNIYEATGYGDQSEQRSDLMNRSGALHEMATLSGIDAGISDAEGDKKAAEVQKFFAGKAIDAAGGKILERVPGTDILVGKGLDAVFPTDQVEKALEQANASQGSATDKLNYLVLVGEVQHGDLPPQALQAQDALGGTDSYDLNQDGDENDFAGNWDLNGDGDPERMTEEDLRRHVEANLNDEGAEGPARELQEIENAADNPAEFGDFKDHLPDGYRIDEDWFSSDEIYNDQDSEVHYEIERDRASYILTLKDPDGPDVQVRVERGEGGEWAPVP